MVNRRQFLGALSAATVTGLTAPSFRPRGFAHAMEFLGDRSWRDSTPEQAARDEPAWARIQEAFTIDRSVLNFNNGGVSPSPRITQEAMARHLAVANTTPSWALWTLQEPRVETVRQGLARLFGADSEEIAITRNSSESLQTCQFGIDLKAGDEVLTTTQDYHRMIATFQQRERREGVVLKQIEIPVPCEDPAEVVRRFEAAITDRTRMILMCQVINLTGQILPVKGVVQMARARGIPVIVDGAHGFAHLAFQHADLDCDFYGTSLHKWLFAPHGTGLLYVRRDRIADLWPLMGASESRDANIRKFEQIGTHPEANRLAIAESLVFHESIGAARKEARLRYLRDAWAKRLQDVERIRFHTSLDPRFSCGIATVEIEGVSTKDLAAYLWDEERILVAGISHAQFRGIRVSPSVYSTMGEIERFCEVMERVAAKGLPG